MKYVISAIAMVFVIYMVFSAYVIASNGAQYGIAQLEGDGGGGILVGAVSFLAALTTLRWPGAAAIVFLVASGVSVLTGILYQDTLTLMMGMVPFGLAIWTFVLRRSVSRMSRKDTHIL